MSSEKVALVFGASGVSGWSFVNEILHNYPKQGVWDGVLALTNRPLTVADSMWPRDDRLSITSGIDLLNSSEEQVESGLANIQNIQSVTHMIYLAYKANADNPAEVCDNIEMFKRAVMAVDKVCPKLEFVVNQTGSKAYGCHLLNNRPDFLVPPFKEDLPRMGGDADATIFYHQQNDWLAEFAEKKSWSWVHTRPDIVLGFVPNENVYSLNMSIGFFLALYREINGPSAECPFPGTAKSWKAKCHDSSAAMNARQTIHVALSPKTKKGDCFNLADEREPHAWADHWPRICALFGLQGVKRDEDNPIEVRRYIKDNKSRWTEMEDKYGLKKGHIDNDRIMPGFEYFLLSMFEYDRQFDMSKMYDEMGFEEERGVEEVWGGTFDMMKKANLIPAVFK